MMQQQVTKSKIDGEHAEVTKEDLLVRRASLVKSVTYNQIRMERLKDLCSRRSSLVWDRKKRERMNRRLTIATNEFNESKSLIEQLDVKLSGM